MSFGFFSIRRPTENCRISILSILGCSLFHGVRRKVREEISRRTPVGVKTKTQLVGGHTTYWCARISTGWTRVRKRSSSLHGCTSHIEWLISTRCPRSATNTSLTVVAKRIVFLAERAIRGGRQRPSKTVRSIPTVVVNRFAALCRREHRRNNKKRTGSSCNSITKSRLSELGSLVPPWLLVRGRFTVCLWARLLKRGRVCPR